LEAKDGFGGEVGLFNRKPKSLLPPDIVQMMERFGRHEIDPMCSDDDSYAVFQATQEPLLNAARENPQQFIQALADACVPVGGWTVYGADRTVINLIGTTPGGEDWFRILDASIQFLRSNFVPPMRVPQYAWERFLDQGGTGNTWLELRPPPDRGAVQITPLRDGETRRIVKLGPEPDANVVLVRRDGDTYVALVDAKWSDENPTRSQSEWKRASDLYELYVDVAWSSQVWDWADPEIEPFLPAPKARI
jgi:hypothetical protein